MAVVESESSKLRISKDLRTFLESNNPIFGGQIKYCKVKTRSWGLLVYLTFLLLPDAAPILLTINTLIDCHYRVKRESSAEYNRLLDNDGEADYLTPSAVY